MLVLKEERTEETTKGTKNLEKKALQKLAAEQGDDLPLDRFVQEVLLPRHLREMADLAQILDREIEASRLEANAKVFIFSAHLNHTMR